MKLKNLLFAAAAVLGVVACQNKPSVAEGVTVDPAEITFAKEGETKEVTITTADEWKLSVPDDLSWLEISDKKGTGTTKVTLKAPDNTDGFDRSGNITVKAGMYSARIKISQPGKGEKVDSEIEKLLSRTLNKDEVVEGAVDLKDIQVVAKSKTAGVISDGIAMILVYGSFDAAIGDKGDIKGDLTVYSYRNQIKNAVFTKTGNEGVNYGTPLNLNEVLDSYDWENARITYCEAKGTVRYDGSKYYNVFLDGRSKDVSIQYWDGDLATLKDKIVEFSGFFVSGTNHVAVFPVGEIEIKGDAEPEVKPEPGEQTHPLTSNVTWLSEYSADTSASPDKATINGTENVDVLKLGTGKKSGYTTITFPQASTKLSFYAIAWNGKAGTNLVFKSGETEVARVDGLNANSGLANKSPYTITIDDNDFYTVTFSSALTEVVVSTESDKEDCQRAGLFGVNAE